MSIKSVHFESDKYRDILIKLSLFCKETELTSFVDSIDDLNILLNNSNPILNEFFEHSFFETSYCEEIEAVNWKSS